MSGIKTINTAGGANFNSFGEAIAQLNAHGVGSGGVTFNVAAGATYFETVPPITGSGSLANPIVFQKNGIGVNPSITSTGTGNYGHESSGSVNGNGDAVLAINGADYVTWDGIDLSSGNYIPGQSCVEFGVLLRNASATNGAQHNTIKNCTITLNRTNSAPSIGICQTTNSSFGGIIPSAADGANSYNRFLNYYIQNTGAGIYLYGNTSFPDISTEAGATSENTWSNIGSLSANDIGNGSFATYGIRINSQDSVKIYRNEIRNITGTSSSTVDGIWIDHSGSSTLSNGLVSIYSNSIHDLNNYSSVAGIIRGIRVNLSNNVNSVSQIYNNFIFGLHSSSTVTSSRRIIGIHAQENGSASASFHQFWNNSVRIEPLVFSASNSCFEATSTLCKYDIRNNIFVNATANQSGAAKHYCISTELNGQIGGVGSVSDYNDFNVVNSGNGFVGRTSSNDHVTLVNWNSAVNGQDDNSIAINPEFLSASDLHISSTSANVNDQGISITTVLKDIDGDLRSLSSPDIGADEYTPTICFGIPTAGSLQSNGVSGCGPRSFELAINGNSSNTGISFDWQIASSLSGPFTSLSAPNQSTYATAILSIGSHYFRCVVTCTLSGSSSSTDTIELTIHPIITASITPANVNKCPGQSTALLAGPSGGGNVFSWNTGASSSFIGVNPDRSTDYSVVVTAPTGCSSIAESHIQVDSKITSSVSAFPPAICAGSSTQLTATVNGYLNLKITEVTQFRTGLGNTPSYPSQIVGQDLVEFSNWGELPLDMSGMVYELWRDTSLSISYTFLPGTIVPAQKVLVLCLGTGVNNDTLLYFNTGNANDQLNSGTLTGHLLRLGTDIIDVVALNGYVWTAGSKVISSDWSGSILNSTSRAGVIRSATSDNNLASDWIVSNSPSPTQSLGNI
ncbi:MAG: hypothetical protein IPK10_08075 [Bacteroidetes bacterium]|nr:hypothetical protein [Bacteroidota bacterium]